MFSSSLLLHNNFFSLIVVVVLEVCSCCCLLLLFFTSPSLDLSQPLFTVTSSSSSISSGKFFQDLPLQQDYSSVLLLSFLSFLLVPLSLVVLKFDFHDTWGQRDNAGDPIGWTNRDGRVLKCGEVCQTRQTRNTRHNANIRWTDQPGQD